MSDAEVEQLDAIDLPVDKKQVARLEVAMDDSECMRCAECFGHAQHKLDAFLHREPAAAKAGLEVFAVQPFHGEVELSGRCAAVRDIADDARMPELGEEPGLP